MYNFFRYHVGDDQLAEDLTSESFEKAWRNRERYRRNLAAFSTWLFTIARRVAIDHYRRQRPEASLDDALHLPHEETPEDLAQAHADHARLSDLLSRLADRDRELVALKYGAGLTNRTIAGLSGLAAALLAAVVITILLFASARAFAYGVIKQVGGYGFTQGDAQPDPGRGPGPISVVQTHDSVSVQITGHVPSAGDPATASSLAGFNMRAMQS